MLNRLKIGPKLTVILLLVFMAGSAIGGLVLSKSLEHRAEEKVVSEGILLMESIKAVRLYTDQQVRPLLERQLGEEEFVPEVVPAYSARRVFENLQAENPSYAEMAYREAVLNPTNPADQADAFETSLIDQFLASPNSSPNELSGFRALPDRGLVFYSARPIRIEQASCLRCHGAPEAAPQAMLDLYGRENGFGWDLNKTIGTQIVYVPAAEVFSAARQAFSSVMGIFFLVFAIALLCLNWLLKPTVIQPIQYLARLSQRLAADDIRSEDDVYAAENQRLTTVVSRQDELGQLGGIFQAMINQVVAREQRLRQQIRDLKIEIDERRKAEEVQEIVETDYFQDLQQKAKRLRQRHETDESPEESP